MSIQYLLIVEFEWDDDNAEHLARHGIAPNEAEELFEGPRVRRRGGTDAPDRFLVLGRTILLLSIKLRNTT